MYRNLGPFASSREHFVHLAHSPSPHQHFWWLEHLCSLSTQLSPLTNELSSSYLFLHPTSAVLLLVLSRQLVLSIFCQPEYIWQHLKIFLSVTTWREEGVLLALSEWRRFWYTPCHVQVSSHSKNCVASNASSAKLRNLALVSLIFYVTPTYRRNTSYVIP